jgi:hypothetical protein
MALSNVGRDEIDLGSCPEGQIPFAWIPPQNAALLVQSHARDDEDAGMTLTSFHPEPLRQSWFSWDKAT